MRAVQQLALACMFAAGCTGTIEEPFGRLGHTVREEPRGGIALGVGRSGDASGVLAACGAPRVGATPLRRLASAQYVHTVEDLLGVTPDVAGLPAGDTSHGYEVATGMSSLLVEAYAASAHAIAGAVDPKKLALSCDPATGDDACAKAFVERFSRRAFRRATAADEHARLLAVFAAGRAEGGFDGGVRLVIEAVLQSPSFLYHVDVSAGVDESGLAQLDPYALASRLSYLVWGSAPDDALLDAAASGALATIEGLDAEARRLFTARPEAARRGFRDFYRQWLSLDALSGLERDAARYPEFSRALVSDLAESIARQIDHVVWALGGGVDALLGGDTFFVNARTAPLFGASAVDAGFVPLVLDRNVRRGVLTHPALLSVLSKPNQSDPVLRGKFVRERLLCQTIAPPPPDVATVAPDPAPGLSTRRRFAEHAANARCAACHRLMDPIGFGLERYDALGRFRTVDEGVQIDASGEIVASDGVDGRFEGGVALAERLAGSARVHECVATQYFRFALGRVETDADRCALTGMQRRFANAGGSLKELIVAVVKSEAFRYRTVPAVSR